MTDFIGQNILMFALPGIRLVVELPGHCTIFNPNHSKVTIVYMRVETDKPGKVRFYRIDPNSDNTTEMMASSGFFGLIDMEYAEMDIEDILELSRDIPSNRCCQSKTELSAQYAMIYDAIRVEYVNA